MAPQASKSVSCWGSSNPPCRERNYCHDAHSLLEMSHAECVENSSRSSVASSIPRPGDSVNWLCRKTRERMKTAPKRNTPNRVPFLRRRSEAPRNIDCACQGVWSRPSVSSTPNTRTANCSQRVVWPSVPLLGNAVPFSKELCKALPCQVSRGRSHLGK